MSQLAFNIHGERFAPPSDFVFWRVRRLKPGGRGVPEVVFGTDGLPLVVPSEADVDEFRRMARNAPGRYRLDPIDSEQGACEDGTPAYVHFEEVAIEPSAPAVVGTGNDDLLRTVIAANTEMVRCMAEKFANVMDSAATLLRAADAAGMPQREIKVIDVEPVRRDAEVVVAAAEEGDSQLAAILQSALEKVMPLVGHTINTKVLGLSDAQSLALLGASVQADLPELAEPETPGESISEEGEVAHRPVSIDDEADTEPRAQISPMDFLIRARAVEAELSKTEVAILRSAIAQMSPATLEDWKNRLMDKSPGEAAALIRKQIEKGGPS